MLAAALASCAAERTPAPAWHQEAGYRWRDLEVGRRSASPGFTRMDGRKSGVLFQNTVSDSTLANRILGQGAGVAMGDVDGDGLVDVFVARTEGCSALYKNRGGWRFDDIASQAGVGACDRHSTAAAFADIEGDGDLDLILLATNGPNATFVNDGQGRFAERRDLGLDSTGKGGTAIAMADIDGDGTLDLYVANYKPYHLDDSIPPQQRAVNQIVRQVAPGRFEIVPEFRTYYKLVMRPDMGGLRMTTRGETDDLYLNKGGRFTRVPLTAGTFRDADGRPIAEEAESFGLAARFADLNGDGAPDLYVANDFEDPDQLWLNDGKGTFRSAEWTAQRQISNSAMGIDVADVNGDGRPDVFEVDMLSNESRRLRTQIPTHTALPKRPGDIETQLQQQRNALFVNRGDGTFAEIGMLAGVQASGWSWSTMFLDVDLDGWQDILIANGHLWDTMDADIQEALQNRFNPVQWRRYRWQFPALRLKNVAFRNRGDMTFEDASATWRFGTEEDISHAMASADLDGDGDLDVVVNRLGSPALLLRNEASAARIAVRVVGDAPNSRAVGAKLRLLGGAIPIQEREIAVGGLYMSHSDHTTSFAMGMADSATLIVDWRDGKRTTVAGVRPNRLYEITTATAVPRAPADTARAAERTALFEDVTPQLGGHAHTDPAFDDWARQLLLPNSLSQLGPGVAWFDFDRDGDEDLLIGTGRSGRLGVFRNNRGKLAAHRAQGPEARADFTSVLGLAERRDTRILAGVSSWEGQPPQGTPPLSSVVGVPVSRGAVATNADQVVPPQEAAAGPLALGDYDADGDLDLFVGGRAIPAHYPRSASSQLFKNEGGNFTVDVSQADVLDRVGLVSAAIFADVNSDGHPDLALAREWGSILLLLNDGRGKFGRAADSWGLNRLTSRWNGIASGDLDGDGRLDLVATSWGRNTMTPADSARPLVLLHGSFGSGGEEEPLLAREDPRIRGLAPINSYARVRVVLRDLPSRIPTFAAYADANVEKILGPAMSRLQRKSATTFDHHVFLNRGDRFSAAPLPAEAQFAPAFYAGVADFNGDGREDLFLSQNFFPTAVGIPRYDAGRGLLLAGDGKGGLTPLSGQQSGILVYGDQRGAAYADFDRDGRLDLVVSQNAAATKLFRNRAGRPGLRVRLNGPPSNPDGVGAQVRIVYSGRDVVGPIREIHAGSGYWSQDGAVQVFGLASTPAAVVVRWVGGAETRVSVPPGAREVSVSYGSR
jgi:hypothetical protein